jgi:undecaprenyl diphosphate synthase
LKSTLSSQERRPLHVAIIMDGNGRWAIARGLPRVAGHQAGVAALQEIIKVAPQLGITTLSAYAFSTENWRRPVAEVSALMDILRSYLQNELARLVDAGVRLTVLGRRDRLPDGIADLISHAERVTVGGGSLDLRLAIDYSGRDAILEAFAAIEPGSATRAEISWRLNARGGGPDIDLLIRTSGEQRLSDFMLWEAAYAELYFTETLWPDFDRSGLVKALEAFCARNRRYGGLSPAAPSAIRTLLVGSPR